MELMVSAALFPSMILCLCCLWCQLRSQWKATRKIGDGVSDGRSAKGRRFTADELSRLDRRVGRSWVTQEAWAEAALFVARHGY